MLEGSNARFTFNDGTVKLGENSAVDFRIGQTYTLDSYLRYGPQGAGVDLALPIVSLAPASIALPPFGTLGIDPSQAVVLPLIQVPQPAGGRHAASADRQQPGPARHADLRAGVARAVPESGQAQQRRGRRAGPVARQQRCAAHYTLPPPGSRPPRLRRPRSRTCCRPTGTGVGCVAADRAAGG